MDDKEVNELGQHHPANVFFTLPDSTMHMWVPLSPIAMEKEPHSHSNPKECN
jgi:hypothetical protein